MLTPDLIASLKAIHGEDLRKVTVGDHEFVVRPPSRIEYKRFSDKLQDEQKKRGAAEELVRCCTVYPAPDAIEAIVEKHAGILHNLANPVLELAGLAVEATVEKLLASTATHRAASTAMRKRCSPTVGATIRRRHELGPCSKPKCFS